VLYAHLVRRLVALCGAVGSIVLLSSFGAAPALATSSCNLGPGGAIHHVVYIQFDNQHLQRDNPNVPSDIEQTPALKSFLQTNGTLDSNDHTILISHTAGGILASLTGLYPDRNGLGVSNSYGVFKSDGSIDSANVSGFTYWTDPVTVADPLPNLITDGQKNTPAPWVPYTRAGCTVGAFSIADMELENFNTTPTGDITKVFGKPSAESDFVDAVGSSGNAKQKAMRATDFEGIAIHCSAADSTTGGLCDPAHGGKPDVLPDEPGGYNGFNGMFGAVFANQVVDQPGGFLASTPDGFTGAVPGGGTSANYPDQAPPVNDVFDFSHTPGGQGSEPATLPGPSAIVDSQNNNGFPNVFSPTAAQTLGYDAAMLESGVPVVMSYIRDAHDVFENTGACAGLIVPPATSLALGPGSACYVQQLHDQEQAFEAFFARLADDGINKSNTLFVITVEEGDHFAGGPPTNQGACDGVNTPCTYTAGTTGPNTVGEITTSLPNLITNEFSDPTAFSIHFDDAPTVYVPNPDKTGILPPTDPRIRQLEREMAAGTITNPRTGNIDSISQHVADKQTQDILHMDNSDPLRTPSFTLFGNADYFFQVNCGAGASADTTQAGCPIVGTGFAWNHGDDNPEIAKTFLGIVGPNVNTTGVNPNVWTDHTDVRPTMLAALGLHDDYANDGDVVPQFLTTGSLPTAIQNHLTSYEELEAALKQLNAPFGQFAHDAEVVSTTAVQTTSPQVYAAWDSQLANCKTLRDQTAGPMQAILNNAAFNGGAIDDAAAGALIASADQLIGNMHTLAGMNTPPSFMVCGSTGQGPKGDKGDQGNQGNQGPQGQQGGPGQNGAAGQNGAQGPQGLKGDTGATGGQGPKGDTGARGPAGRDAKVTCTAHGTRTVKVTCKVTFSHARSARDETRLVLTRHGRVVASGRTVHSGRIALHASHRLKHGTYRLVVSELVGGKPVTILSKSIHL